MKLINKTNTRAIYEMYHDGDYPFLQCGHCVISKSDSIVRVHYYLNRQYKETLRHGIAYVNMMINYIKGV